MLMRPAHCLALLILMIASAQAAIQEPPKAVISDPPKDPAHPPHMAAVQIAVHGEAMNAVFYFPGGSGPHPTVFLLHGSPGNEQNLDLAQAIRRAGWNVLTLHYRGSWGSAGQYSLAHCIEDSEAAVAFLRDPKIIAQYGIESDRIVVMGHSLGGFLAARLGAHDPSLMGIAMIAPWDVGHDGPIMAQWSKQTFQDAFGDMPGRIVGATGQTVVAEAVAHQKDWSLDSFSNGLAKHRVLIVVPHDFDRDRELNLAALLQKMKAPVTSVDMDTDHTFGDSRIALETAVVRWLAALPNAPKLP
jgi:pimeloyl-ACP methyl ester carboxylesterase